MGHFIVVVRLRKMYPLIYRHLPPLSKYYSCIQFSLCIPVRLTSLLYVTTFTVCSNLCTNHIIKQQMPIIKCKIIMLITSKLQLSVKIYIYVLFFMVSGVEEAMGLENSGVLYALWNYPAQAADELSFKEGDMVTILQKPEGSDWWWASLCGREGFVPNNYFGVRSQFPH